MKRALVGCIIAFILASLIVGCPPKTSEKTALDAQLPKNATPPGEGGMTAAATGTVSVDIPCGLTVPLREAMAAFEKANPGVKMEGTYDNAITNAREILKKGKRPDLFISPGKREMGILEEQGLIDGTTKAAIGFFELVVVAPKDNPRNVHSLQDLPKADVISLPNPEYNSIGVYGKEALQKAGLWDKLTPKGDEKIIRTEFPITAYEMIASGKAEAALMFRNCPMQTYPEKLKKGSVVIVADVDKKLYEEPLCYIAVMKDAPNPSAAKQFIAFLATPEGQKLLGDNGLDALNERAQELLPEGIKGPDAAAIAAGAVAPDPKAEGVAEAGVGKAEDLKTPIKVEAYYPDNAGHAHLKTLVQELPKRYPGKVQGEFIDFTSDEGYVRWHDERKMSCGGFLLNGQQTFLVDRRGKMVEVTFMMGEGGEWTREDLYWVLDKATGKKP
ncbi:MAG: molybdate ABC transporter substrate-binding protein [Armatimonadetes bacterium]|nr:molybdate ABC transporter substrate-binding protein [Armatimonadota bacterium]